MNLNQQRNIFHRQCFNHVIMDGVYNVVNFKIIQEVKKKKKLKNTGNKRERYLWQFDYYNWLWTKVKLKCSVEKKLLK